MTEYNPLWTLGETQVKYGQAIKKFDKMSIKDQQEFIVYFQNDSKVLIQGLKNYVRARKKEGDKQR